MSWDDTFATKSDMIGSPQKPQTFGFLLIDGFPLMGYAAIVEAFRAANVLAGRPLYEWAHISVTGLPCRASSGATILPERTVGDHVACDALFVFAGGDPTLFADSRTFAWLRDVARRGAIMIGVSGGVYVMGRAGLLDGRRATVHWEYRDAFMEAFPSIRCEPGLYVFDGRRITCAGGMAGMDLAVELIGRDQGHDLAIAVSDWYIRAEPRTATRSQRVSLQERYGVANARMLRVLAHMEHTIEEPVSRKALAEVAGVSLRQLERLFDKHLNVSIRVIYLTIRLEQAEHLLRSTSLTVTQVAMACGFSHASHFSRAFRARHGRAPVLFRQAWSAELASSGRVTETA